MPDIIDTRDLNKRLEEFKYVSTAQWLIQQQEALKNET